MPALHGLLNSFAPRAPVSLRIALLLGLGLALAPGPIAHGQPDTTVTARPDTARRPASAQQGGPSLRPLPLPRPPFGRVQTDSIPARLPHVSLDAMLAEQAGGFLYDLGEYGWPHGWSRHGLAPHRVHLWLDGLPVDDPLTGRPRFELLPPSFLGRPRTGVDPGGGATGVHTFWRAYDPKRPVTEARYRFGNSGLHAVEVGHSQKRRVDLFGRPGLVHLTFGYGGRKADGVYNGSALRRERRIWGRLRYQTNDWTVELSDRYSLYRIGAHGGATPPGQIFETIYLLPVAGSSVRAPRNRRKTIQNGLTARLRAPLLPGFSPTELSARWTAHTFDFRDGTRDTTWTTRMNGGHVRLRQSVTGGQHHLTGTVHGHLWGVARSNVPQFEGTRRAVHLNLRDSIRLGDTAVQINAGGHLTAEQSYVSGHARVDYPAGPLRLFASASLTGQRGAWIEDEGFLPYVQPLEGQRSGRAGRLLKGTAGIQARLDPFDVRATGFAHQIRNAVDLYVGPREGPPPTSYTDIVSARTLPTPVRRAGLTVAAGWRRDARRGLYVTGRGTVLKTLNAGASPLHRRLARTLPLAFGQARLGARFVLFTDLITDLYVDARGWSGMNSRWFHPPTGRLVVPPRRNPVPVSTGPAQVGPSGTVDVRAEVHFRGATLFFTFQNVQAGTRLQTGTFVVPVYPLPPQQFRFGVFWPILG